MSDEQEQERARLLELAKRFRLSPDAVDDYLDSEETLTDVQQTRLTELARRFRLDPPAKQGGKRHGRHSGA